MQKKASNSQQLDLALDTVWSLWTELGVNGVVRRHSEVGIDLEALILATAYLARFDSRILNESLDWCVTNSRFVSGDRLKNLLKHADPDTHAAFGRYAASVRRWRRVSWPAAGEPYDVSPTRRSQLPDLRRPALLQLRLRAFVGVSARAEVIRWLLDQPNRFFGGTELTAEVAYGRDNIMDTLDLLANSGVVEASTMTAGGNQRVYRLDRNSELADALLRWSSVPQQRWAACFRVIVRLVEFASGPMERTPARAANIHRLLGTLQSDLRWLGSYPTLRHGADEVNEGFDRWTIRALRDWARAPEPATS